MRDYFQILPLVSKKLGSSSLRGMTPLILLSLLQGCSVIRSSDLKPRFCQQPKSVRNIIPALEKCVSVTSKFNISRCDLLQCVTSREPAICISTHCTKVMELFIS